MTVTDRLIAPGATRSEAALCYSSAVIGGLLAALLAGRAGGSALVVVVVALIGFDLFGGAVVNATASAKDWFHRPGRTARHHLTFVAVHGQPFVLALVVPGFGWWAAAAGYGIVLGAAVVVIAVPDSLRGPTAFATTVFGVAITTTMLAVPTFLLWFGPVLLIKLLLAHLQPGTARISPQPS
ncbi:hypothetical protein [Nocardia caishijiensis]|uniref:Uncharacterized protein n=1 Tax=Nocardia caishijiensis TaxID=184756 RepID=A0ABQ6YHT2_9NOCA|nr:hypothetical protein [Nocardia caishijiensis]KAF0845150.1 hypothetical protein FNL39_109179 [Nocardia caishijiensis]